tara:strand:+ start:646 stop:942 length:297 start_codon:yes stop_codon:yes gene_type:complete
MSEENISKTRTLKYMKKNVAKKELNSQEPFPLKGINIFRELLKIQNEKLLEKIAEDNFASSDEQKQFISKYHKMSYQLPEVIEDENLELNQLTLIKKK